VDFVRSVVLSDFLAALSIGVAFIIGFWAGVDWYRKKILGDLTDEKKARAE